MGDAAADIMLKEQKQELRVAIKNASSSCSTALLEIKRWIVPSIVFTSITLGLTFALLAACKKKEDSCQHLNVTCLENYVLGGGGVGEDGHAKGVAECNRQATVCDCFEKSCGRDWTCFYAKCAALLLRPPRDCETKKLVCVGECERHPTHLCKEDCDRYLLQCHTEVESMKKGKTNPSITDKPSASPDSPKT